MCLSVLHVVVGTPCPNTDVDEEPQLYLIHDEDACSLHDNDKGPLRIWAWTSFELQVGHYDYWLMLWEWSEEKGKHYAYN